MALRCPVRLGTLWPGSPPGPWSIHNYPAAINEALVPAIKICGREMARIFIQPANALPGVLRGWPRGWNPNPFCGSGASRWGPGTMSPAKLGCIPRRRGAGGDTAPPQSPVCPPSISTAGQGLPDAPAGARCLSSPPFLKEDKREREAAFWVEFLRVWLFRFPSSLRGPKKRGTLCQRRRLCKRHWLHGALGLHGTPLRPPKKSRGRGNTAGMEGTQWGHSTQEHPGLGWGMWSLRDASCGMQLGRGGSGERQRGLQVRRSGDMAGTWQGTRWGQAWSSSAVPRRDGKGAWVCPGLGRQPKGTKGSSIPGCGGGDASPGRATLALTSVP